MNGVDRAAALDRGLAFLGSQQLDSGEFPAYVARDATLTTERRLDHTSFVTSYAVYSLGHVRDPRAGAMVARALDFIAGEMEAPGVWRYWTKAHPFHRTTPPDVDDTACAAVALRLHDRDVPSLRRLFLANRDRRGRFYTWFAPRLAATTYLPWWRVTLREALRLPYLLAFYRLTEAAVDDVDGVVNANVLGYLGSCPEARPVAAYLREELEAGREDTCDRWHLNACSFYYAVSRAYAHDVTELEPLRSDIVRRIEARQAHDGSVGNPSETALAAAALLNFKARGPALERAVSFLVECQRMDGSWEAHALYYGGPKRYYGWGSEALTTALCMEVLARSDEGESPTAGGGSGIDRHVSMREA